MIINKHDTYIIHYTDASGNKTVREIFALTEIPKNIKAYDLTYLSPTDKKKLVDIHAEYMEYVDGHINKMFNFHTWYEHTAGKLLPADLAQFRQFTVQRLEISQQTSVEVSLPDAQDSE
jgi:hypothetical protein